jgi:hypothetical protein
MWFSLVLPMGQTAIASCSQIMPSSNSNSNGITSITSIHNPELVNGSTLVVHSLSHGGLKWCLWSDIGFPLCATIF